MTSEQIGYILEKIGNYSQNLTDPIDLREVSSIVLDSNESYYPESGTTFRFDSEGSLLEIYKGGKIDSIIDYKQIEAFILETPSYRKAPYKMGTQI